MHTIDLRSDTVTKPTKEMLDAMGRAEVGDDHFEEDATANALHELAAAMMGKEAALFMPTGTMGNQIAILTHCRRGDEMICDSEAHTFIWEKGGPAVLASVLVRPVPSDKGVLDPAKVRTVLRPAGTAPRAALLWIENTHCWHGGNVTPVARMRELYRLAHDSGASVHLDGARIFNAALALGVKPSELAAEADSVMFCLSKGLCCPVGSILAGSKAFIKEAKHYRRLLGGQMRQVGYLAAAGIVALKTMVERLREDHDNARTLAKGLNAIKGIHVDMERVRTNMVVFDIGGVGVGAPAFLAQLKAQGVLAVAYNERLIRMVPTRHTSVEDVAYAIAAAERAAAK
jgi:threonine aldolase